MPRPKGSITQRAAAARKEAAVRTVTRRELALRVGIFALNEIEHGGQCHITDYRSVTPAWVLSMYEFMRPRRKPPLRSRRRS